MYFNQMPYFIPVTRKFLLDAYHRGSIKINTYDKTTEPTDPQIHPYKQNVGLMWMGRPKMPWKSPNHQRH
ncbi:MAG: hypothetical protein IPK04_00135 [Bdellovibrionales bacterium]|nr:hypothetical protein [Bdellovibrionales bacterium]